MGDDRTYRFQIQYVPDDDGYFLGQTPELGIRVQAGTRSEALELLEQEVEAAVEQAAQEGQKLPKPADLTPEPGKIELDLSAPVYRDLLAHARAQELSPELLAGQLLSRALGQLEGRSHRRTKARPDEKTESPQPPEEDVSKKEPRGGRRGRGRNQGRGGGRREGYRPDMEDQANFLAYVRDQERGGRGRR